MKKPNLSGKYVLDDLGNPKEEPDVIKWSRWFESTLGTKERMLKQDYIGSLHVSTVFLALDYSFSLGPPLLWETMIFPTEEAEDYGERYCTKKEAIEGHERAIKFAKKLNAKKLSNKIKGSTSAAEEKPD